MKYSCTVLFDASASVDVEADSAEAAANQAEDKTSGHQSLCHQCSETLDTSDSYGVLVYDEAGELVADTRFSEELRRKDTALIRQMHDAIVGMKTLCMNGESPLWTAEFDNLTKPLTAARARLAATGVQHVP